MKYSESIDRYEEWFTTDLLQNNEGHCVGAIGRNLRNGNLEVFNAKATILATGGAGQAYEPTTNGLIVTGDGMAQAYRLGAHLMDMEMVQYHPTCLAGNGILIAEAHAARVPGCSMPRASASWSAMRRTSWSSPPGMSSRAPSRPRSTRGAASRTGRSRST